jgi:tmRNA-binding protein
MSVALARRNKNYEKKQKLKEKDLDREKNLLD